MGHVTFEIDIALPSSANIREAWYQTYSKNRDLRNRVSWETRMRLDEIKKLNPPLFITLTRVSPRSLDTDNLAYAFKSARDGVADAVWPDIPQYKRDNHDGVEWGYNQKKESRKCIIINFEEIEKGTE